MDTCARCGHVLGAGHFCAACGQPFDRPVSDDWRSGTAERPAVRDAPLQPRVPVTPPPAATVPPAGARYPLFADEVDSWPPGPPVAMSAPARTPAEGGHAAPRPHLRPRRWLSWGAGCAALVLVAALGAWLLLRSDDPVASAGVSDPSPSRSRSASDSPSPSPSTSPRASGSPSSEPGAGRAEDVARSATASVPATAAPNEDTNGNLVRYEARNMLDGVPATCWRMPGDGTGRVISLDLEGPTTLTRVGLVNGYAKTATDAQGEPLDWYHGDRRLLTVEWVFDDGTTVRQTLADTRDLQTVRVDDVTTRTVQVRLVSVSAPGTGRAARDYTAISDVALVGTAG